MRGELKCVDAGGSELHLDFPVAAIEWFLEGAEEGDVRRELEGWKKTTAHHTAR